MYGIQLDFYLVIEHTSSPKYKKAIGIYSMVSKQHLTNICKNRYDKEIYYFTSINKSTSTVSE